jgi:hypothetical protein
VSHGLLTSDLYSYINRLGGFLHAFGGGSARRAECLVAGVFPGPLNESESDKGIVKTTEIYTNPLNNWTALDYDESLGRVILGDAVGSIRILEL